MSDKRRDGKKPAQSDALLTFKKALLNIKALPKYFYTRSIKKPAPVKSKIVFVVSFPRSGTHAIGSLLSNEKVGFRYYGEFFIFNAWNSQIERINRFYPFFSLRYSLHLRKQRKSWKYYKFETTSLDAHRTMAAIQSLPGIHIIKIFPQHLSDPVLQSIIAEFKPHIIFLRRNHLDRFVSHKKANASGKWHTASTSDLVIKLDPREFETFITNYTKFYSDYLYFAKEQGCPILDVDFVDLQNPEKVREIQKFAQFDGFSDWDQLTLAPTTVKQDKSSKVQEDFLAEIGKEISDYNFKAVRV
jgi:hypothetical protein